MRYLVIITRGEPAEVAIRLDDREPTVTNAEPDVLVVEVDDDDDGAALKIASDEGSFVLPPELVARHLAASPAAALPIVIPAVHAPRRSAFRPRVDADRHAKPLEGDAVIAGGLDGTPLPVNYVGQKQTDSFLATNQALGAEQFTYGHLRQFETNWEPLGWALDEWIDTLSLGPFEDTVQGDIDVSSGGRRETSGATSATSGSRSETISDSSVREAMRTAMSTNSRSRGWSASVGGPPTGAAASLNPLLALAQSVVGTFQVGFENATTSVRGGLEADLSHDVVNRLEQETSQQLARNNESLASVANAWRETRRLRALRNLGPGRSENLALFSVVRQWLVTTVEAPPQNIVLIKAHELDKPFGREDLFAHRTVLTAGLLDSELAGPLAPGGASYRPRTTTDEPTIADPVQAERVTGTLAVSNPARGRDSKIRVEVVFDIGDDDHVFAHEVTAAEEGAYPFEIAVDGPLHKLVAWRFTFDNPGWMLDQRTSFTPVNVEVHAGGRSWPVTIPGPITLAPRAPRGYDRGFTPPSTAKPPAENGAKPAGEVQQLLIHLNANRPYYRLLIDLLTDPVTRFVRLTERPWVPMPADLRPIGVAGAHLAFLTGDDVTAPGDERPPIKRVLATPAGGTFVEVLEGRTKIEMASTPPAWPTVALEPDHTLPWPTPIDLPTIEDAKDEAEDGVKEPPAAQAAPKAELPGKLAEIMKSLEILKSAVDALTPKAPEQTPEKEATAEPGAEAQD